MNYLAEIPIVLYLCLVTLGIGLALAVFRLLRGPTLPDRVVALDVIATLAIGLLVVFAMLARQPLLLDVALAMALVVFLGTIAFARYMEHEKPDSE